MDYVVGSVAALISGNVTPNRPKLIRRALTPTKHQPSPNVTPKSEVVEDRSIFLSPTQQKKKAIVKKSPKRIFQNPDLDSTEDHEGNSSLLSPKAEKVKKHLKEKLDADEMGKKKLKDPNVSSNNFNKSSDTKPQLDTSNILNDSQSNECGLSKKKKKLNSQSLTSIDNISNSVITEQVEKSNIKSPKKKKQDCKSVTNTNSIESMHSESGEPIESSIQQSNPKSNDDNIKDITNVKTSENKQKKNKKRKKKNKKASENDLIVNTGISENNDVQNQDTENKNTKNKKNKKEGKSKKQVTVKLLNEETNKMDVEDNAEQSESDAVKSKNIPNPNAITEKDSDSEHDSDDNIASENEELNEDENNEKDQSSDEEDTKLKPSQNKETKSDKKGTEVITKNEIERTLFVGNVPFSSKCKKEIKKIFNKYGQIETIRIRTIPIKDARVTPKLAVIKNEIHPERTTVNVYIKYASSASVGKALAANNTLLNGNHLRVSRSDTSGSEHDPRCAIFVGNMPFAIEDETLRSKFEKCGEIVSVRVVRDKKTNAGKGFGYVNFKSKDGVELALALSEEDLTIKNRIMRVKRCNQMQGRGQKSSGGTNVQGKWNQRRDQGREEGAVRRLTHKRKLQEGGNDGPPNKMKRNIMQPSKEKKSRKEFVGMTAGKKKKHKFDKGQKKKKALSEILTKYS